MKEIPLKSWKTDRSHCGCKVKFLRLSFWIPQKITGGLSIFVWLFCVFAKTGTTLEGCGLRWYTITAAVRKEKLF